MIIICFGQGHEKMYHDIDRMIIKSDVIVLHRKNLSKSKVVIPWVHIRYIEYNNIEEEY